METVFDLLLEKVNAVLNPVFVYLLLNFKRLDLMADFGKSLSHLMLKVANLLIKASDLNSHLGG